MLVDSVMPDITGIDLVEKIRSDTSNQESRIILLAQPGQRLDEEERARLGIACRVQKLATENELLCSIMKTLGIATDADQPDRKTRETLPAREHEQKMRILLAEDDPFNLKLGCRILEKMGHSVTPAANGRDVLRALDENSYDLILMDIQMPIMDGLEATKVIRQRERALGIHTPIVALTGHVMEGDR